MSISICICSILILLVFCRFPDITKETDRFMVWWRNSHIVKQPNKNSRLCSEHFSSDQFDRTGQHVRLQPTAIPTQFVITAPLEVNFIKWLNDYSLWMICTRTILLFWVEFLGIIYLSRDAIIFCCLECDWTYDNSF